MSQFKDDVRVGDLTVNVSTVDLAHIGGEGWETALFWENGSDVVASYTKAADAIRGHKAFCNPAVVSYVLNNQAW